MGAAEAEQITAWVHARLSEDWFTEPAAVTVDREEITVVGRLARPDGVTDETPAEEAREAAVGRIQRFREETRDARISIARKSRCKTASRRRSRVCRTTFAASA